MLKVHFLRQDADSHWYLVPEELIAKFDDMTDGEFYMNDEERHWIEFIELFSEFKIDHPYALAILKEEIYEAFV